MEELRKLQESYGEKVKKKIIKPYVCGSFKANTRSRGVATCTPLRTSITEILKINKNKTNRNKAKEPHIRWIKNQKLWNCPRYSAFVLTDNARGSGFSDFWHTRNP